MFEVIEVPAAAGRPHRMGLSEQQLKTLAERVQSLQGETAVQIGTGYETAGQARARARVLQRELKKEGIWTSTVVFPEGDTFTAALRKADDEAESTVGPGGIRGTSRSHPELAGEVEHDSVIEQDEKHEPAGSAKVDTDTTNRGNGDES